LITPECFRISRMFDIDLIICNVIGIEISSLKFPQEPLSLYNMYRYNTYIHGTIYCSLIKLNYSILLIRLFSPSPFVSYGVQLLGLLPLLYSLSTLFSVPVPHVHNFFINLFLKPPLLWLLTRWIRVLIVLPIIFFPFSRRPNHINLH